jgi:hypothetical protein
MKNIFLLPTDQSSRLFLEYGDGDLCLSNQFLPQTARSNNQNMYITSDEPIKKDDWYYNERLNQIFQAVIDSGYNTTDKEFKIILTTNQDLIADGVQDIDDEFLEWFVKNSSCEFVRIESWETKGEWDLYYKITIPQEEPKQELHICKYCDAETTQSDDDCYAKPKQEKLEEAAERHYINCIPSDRHSFIAGAKWQAERMYSEEEVKEILEKRDKHNLGNLTLGSRWLTVEDWFEQLKKK